MVGNASATGTEYFEVWDGSSGTITMDGDTIYLQSGTPLEITEDMFDLEIGDYYDNFFEIEDGSGIMVVDEYESFAANYSQETRFFNNTLLDDCGYEAQVELLHYNDTTGNFDMVNNIMFYVEVGDCNSILADFEDSTLDEEMVIMLMPDNEPEDEEQPDIYAMGDMKIDSNFRGLLDSDGDGDVTESELYFYSGLYDALHDEHYPDSGINWTLDGVDGISEGDDVQLFFGLEELLGPITNATYTADNAWVQSYLMFNVTGLGGLENDSTQTLEFDDFSNDGNGMMKVQERGQNLTVTNVTLNGTAAYYIEAYSSSADTTFECSSEVGGETDMEIDFYKVNDGTEDCGDGSDEPQDFDSDGITDNWFDCNDGDGTTVNMDVVNDGAWDCNDGEDEGMEYVPATWEIPVDEGTLVLELGAIQMQDIDIFMESVTSEEIRFLPLDELLVDVVFAFDGDVRAEFDVDGDGHVSSPELNELWSQLEEAMNDDDESGDDKANFTLDGVFHSEDVYFTPDLYQLMGPTDAGDGEVVMTFTVITLDTSNDHSIAIDEMEFDGMLCIENTEYFTVGNANWSGVSMSYDAVHESTCGFNEAEGMLEFELLATNDNNYDEENLIDKVDLGFEVHDNFGFVEDGGVHVEFTATVVSYADNGNANSQRMKADVNGDGIVSQSEASMHAEEFDLLDDERTFHCSSEIGGEPDMEIDFQKVNDGTEDCGDGSDEPQDFDGDGITDNWFDCNDGNSTTNGTTVNMDVVNDGVDNCPNGEDEPRDDDFFFFDGVAFDDYTSVVYFHNGLFGDVNQSVNVQITVLYTFNFSSASQDDGHLIEVNVYDDEEGNDENDDEVWNFEFKSNLEWNLVNITHNGVTNDTTDDGYYSAQIMDRDNLNISAYYDPTGCPVGQHEDAATGDCVDDAAGPEDCEGSDIWDADSQSCIPDPAMSCGSEEAWDYVLEACVDLEFTDCAGVVNGNAYLDAAGVCVEEDTTITCGDNETLETNAAGVEECVEIVVPQECPEGEMLDPLTNACVEDSTVDPVDTAPNCDVFYWVGSAGNPTNDWNWTEMMEGWTEFTAPNNGEYTLALPKGDYFVYFGCWDAEGDDITLAVDGLPEIQEFEAEESWVWGWDEFKITDEDVGMQHDMVVSWSSTDFGGNVTIHFTGVDSIADSVAESDTGGLPGFTASLGLMAMLGAALILARRKD